MKIGIEKSIEILLTVAIKKKKHYVYRDVVMSIYVHLFIWESATYYNQSSYMR